MKRILGYMHLCLIVFSFALPASAEKFTVGAILSLSGGLADYGSAIANSIELARREDPERFSNINFVVEDVGTDAKQAVAAFHKLRNIDHADLILSWGVVFCKVLSPFADMYQMPFVGLCVDPESSRGKNYVIRFMNYSDEYEQLMLKYLHNLGLNRIGIIMVDQAFLEVIYNAMQRNLLPGQSLELIERYLGKDMDLKSGITKARFKKFDAIGVFFLDGQTSQFFKQAKELGLHTPVFGTNYFECKSEVKASGGAMEGAVFVNNEVRPEYIKKYKAAFGMESQLAFGAPAYEFAMLMGELFNNLHVKLSPEEILKRMENIGTRPGYAAGPYTFRNDPFAGKYFQFPLVVKKVKGEGWEVLR